MLDSCIWSPDGTVEMEITTPVLGRSRLRQSIAMPTVSNMKSTDPLGMTVFGSALV